MNTAIPEYVSRMGLRRPKRSQQKPPVVVPQTIPVKITVAMAPASSGVSFQRMMRPLAMMLSMSSRGPSAA